MLLFDIGANRGDATYAGLRKGYEVVAIEAAPRVFAELAGNFIYSPNVKLLKFAVSDSVGEHVEFFECVEDGLSTLEKDWLTNEKLPYNGKQYRTIKAVTCTIDWLVEKYGTPDLIKIDVEGAEWVVLRGMTKKYKDVCFEWTLQTADDHRKQLEYLADLGYTEVGPQFIVQHLEEPKEYFAIEDFDFNAWLEKESPMWENGGWKEANLRPTADVGMLWVR